MSPDPSPIAGAPRTVLLVEDNEDNRAVYATLLRHVGYRVVEALDGQEGLTQAQKDKPDVILLDISLPVLDGWTVAQRLRAAPDTRDIHIVALTAHAMPGDRERALDGGFDAYLTKPVSPRAVVAEVERLIGRARE